MRISTFIPQDTLGRATWILCILYTVGLVGIASPWHAYFVPLTPVNLLISFGWLVATHQNKDAAFYRFLVGAFAWGWLVEWVGVHTGLIFGSYAYGTVLGLKVSEVPLMIGINWAMLLVAFGSVFSRLALPTLSKTANVLVKSILGALAMVLLDVCMEPVAMRLGFWDWEGSVIPMQNYVGWFVTALLPLMYWNFSDFSKQNPLSPLFILIQFVFFLALNILA